MCVRSTRLHNKDDDDEYSHTYLKGYLLAESVPGRPPCVEAHDRHDVMYLSLDTIDRILGSADHPLSGKKCRSKVPIYQPILLFFSFYTVFFLYHDSSPFRIDAPNADNSVISAAQRDAPC